MKQESKSLQEKNNHYTLTIKERAVKALRKIPRPLALKIDAKIEALAVLPRPEGCKKLEGYENTYRIRHSEYRVVYTVDDKQRIVDIVHIGNRKDVYRKLG